MRWYSFLKWITFAVNSIFVIGGVMSLIATFWKIYTTDFLPNLVKPNAIGVYILIITLTFLIITGAVGCYGVYRESRSVLKSNTILLCLTLTTGTIGGIWTYVTANQTDEMSLNRVRNIVRHDYGRDSSKTALLDIVQQSFQCCGSENYSSWATSFYSQMEMNDDIGDDLYFFSVPRSCCIEPLSHSCQKKRKITSKSILENFIYMQGCVSKLQATSTHYGRYSLSASIGVGFIELMGIAGSTLLSRALRLMENSTP